MKTRLMGPTGIPVSVIGQGTWYLEQSDRREAIQAVRRSLELGMTHLDTAEMYGSGEVERMVGEAIVGHRAEVFLASKVLPEHASYKGTLRACEASLKRLRTEYLNLYLLHWAGQHPLAETIRAFEQLVSDGKVRAYGVSNFDPGEIEEAVSIAGPEKIACNQVLYHLRQRAIEHGVIPACEKHGIAVVAYSPFGSGRFPSHNTPGGKVLAKIAASHRATPHQVALAFLTKRQNIFTIPKASQARHVEENAEAADLELSKKDIHNLEHAFPLGSRPRGLPTI